jgi:HK97 family phage portal protein
MFTSGMFSGSGATAPAGTGGWMGAFSSAGNRTRAGINVTPASALAITAVQRAVSILAESFAQLPCGVYKRGAGDSIEPLNDHPVSALLNYAPNGWMTPFEFNEFKQISLGLRGNAFFLIIRDKKYQVKELHPLHPDRVQIMVSPIDRMPYYRVLHSPVDTFQGMYSANDIHHVRWISDNGYAGLSPISLHAEAIGLVAAVEEHSSSVFGNGTKLSGILEYPQKITDEETLKKIKNDWRDMHSGSSNAGSVAVLAGGGKFSPLSMSNEDAELILTRGWGVRDVARIFGVPAHMLGESSQVKANTEQLAIEFVSYGLMPWIKRHEEAIERDLLTMEERKSGVYVKFDVSGLIRGDLKSRYESYALGKQWGFLSTNDIRKKIDEPPVDGGNQYLVPLNMADGKTGAPIGLRPDPNKGGDQ